MSSSLGPKFAAVVAKMRRTDFAPEADNGRTIAERMARRAGLTLEEALRALDEEAANSTQAEAERRAQEAARRARRAADQKAEDERAKRAAEKAKRNAEQAERAARWAAETRAMLARRAATVARHGSEEAALAPCWRERLILDAVAPWRTVNRKHPRWTKSLGASSDDPWEHSKHTAQIRSAIAGAYPLPSTFAEAKAELDYWEARSSEMEDFIWESAEHLGNGGLDLAADFRAYMVRELMETDLHLTTLAEVHARFAMYRADNSHKDAIEAALFRDLSALVDKQAQRSAAPQSAPSPAPIRPALDSSIRDALTTDPSRSDRSIAREVGCSPTTVGQIRGQMGLAGVKRSVQRGGQTFSMRSRAGR